MCLYPQIGVFCNIQTVLCVRCGYRQRDLMCICAVMYKCFEGTCSLLLQGISESSVNKYSVGTRYEPSNGKAVHLMREADKFGEEWRPAVNTEVSC